MPAYSLGVPNTQMMCSKFIQYKSNYCTPFPPHMLQVGSWVKAWRPAHMIVSQSSNKAPTPSSSLVTENEPVATVLEKGEKEKARPRSVSQRIPNAHEVLSLLSGICDTTSVAEFELKLDGFQLHVTRDLSGIGIINPPSPSSVPSVSTSVSSNTHSEEPALSDQGPTTSFAITKTGPAGIKSRALLESAADDGMAVIQSPKVGFFRRCRTIKGKRAPPACKEKQIVKEGQVICFIEQLGWEAPIESDVSGEVLKFLCEDGEPVGFGDPIIAILPSFPGIKKLSAES